MKRSHLDGERFDARDVSNAAYTASMFAASVGMIWDLATGHVAVFDRMLTNISDGIRTPQTAERSAARYSSQRFYSNMESRADA